MSRQLLPRDERRAAIVRAAATAFARAGYAETSMEEVAHEAGVTRILLYRHFDSKEELYRAVLDEVTDQLGETYDSVSAGTAEPGLAAIRTYLAVARANPYGYRLLTKHAEREPEFRHYVETVRKDIDTMAGELVGPLVPPRLASWAAHTVVGYLIDAVAGWLDHGSPEDDELFVERAHLGVAGLVAGWAGVSTRPDLRR